MPSAPKPAPAPSVGTQIGQQDTSNVNTNNIQLAANEQPQSNPYGSLDYGFTVDPQTGQRVYSATQNFSTPEQAKFGGTEATGIIQSGLGAALSGAEIPTYANAPNFTNGATSLTAQAEAPVQSAYERFFTPARSQLDNQLRNSGILPGTPAYQQQMDALTQQQNLTEGSWLANFQPTAFGEAAQSYQLPEEMIKNLFNLGQPAQLPGTFINTSQVQDQALNAAQANQVALAQENFNTKWKTQLQNNMMSGIFNSGSSAIPMMAAMFA